MLLYNYSDRIRLLFTKSIPVAVTPTNVTPALLKINASGSKPVCDGLFFHSG
jgi:hypothetical protein